MMESAPISVVQVGSFGVIGDNVYRIHEPAAAMARVPGVVVYEVEAHSRHRDAAALAADVLVLTMTLDVEVCRLIHQRRWLGKPTICEVNDYLPDVQAWNPAYASWSDPRGKRLFRELISRCDAVQVTCDALAERVRPLAQQVEVFPNQLAGFPPLRRRDPGDAVVVGWGGSAGHLHDLKHAAPALIAWLQRHPQARLEIMGDPFMADYFEAVPAHQFVFHSAGSLSHYLNWLQGLDIGLAPLLPTDYNRCRSDVKFLEYASHGVIPVLQRLDPYLKVSDGQTGFLFGDTQEMTAILDRLMSAPVLRQQVAETAYRHVVDCRRIDQHAPGRVACYRALQQRMSAPVAALPPLLEQAGAVSLQSLADLRPLAPGYFRIELTTPAEHHRAAGIRALQSGLITEAAHEFTAALNSDPKDANASSFLGHCYLKQGQARKAQAAFEYAAAIDPLLSRPVRALARLHRNAASHYAQLAAELNPLGGD